MTPDAALDVTRLTPSPPVTAAAAAEAVEACFGLTGQLTRLPGEAGDNFLLDAGEKRCATSTTRWCTGRCCGTSASCRGCVRCSPPGRRALVPA